MNTRKRNILEFKTLVVLLLTIVFSLVFSLSTALAQETAVPTIATPESAAQNTAKAAIAEWQETAQNFSPQAYLDREDPAADICTDFAVIGTTPNLVQGMNINFNDPQEKTFEGEGAEGIIQLSYPASVGEATGQVQVNLRPSGDDENPWEAGRVRFNVADSSTSSVLPSFVTSTYFSWIFIVFSLLLIYSFFRPNFFRRWLTLGWQAILEHRRLVIGTSILLYGLFALGLATGLALPKECIDMAIELIGGSLETIGIVEHLLNGDVLKTASITAVWNFLMGAFGTTFIPALLLGIPAYLINALRFFSLAIPFAGVFEPQLILHLPTLIIELMAYIIVTAGGGMLLVTLFKKGFKGLPLGIRKLWLMLPIALVLLVIGAWYESFSLIVLRPLLFGP